MRQKGYKHTEETRQKISKSKEGKRTSVGTEFKKGHKFSPETIEKMKRTRKKNPTRYWKGKPRSKETKEKLRVATINQILDGRLPKGSNTSIEIIMKRKLDELGIKYIHQFNFNDLFVCDFFIPSLNTFVECDGEYWHNLPTNRRRDAYKKLNLRKEYRLLRFSSYMLKKKIDYCIKLLFTKEITYFDWKNNWDILVEDNKINLDTIERLKKINTWLANNQ